MTEKQDNKDFNNMNPFVADTPNWQSLISYWFNAYLEFLKSASKINKDWYTTFWKPWLNWTPQQQVQDKVD